MSTHDHTTSIIFPEDRQETALATGYSQPDKNPAIQYTLGLKTAGSRRTMIHSLNQIAAILGYGCAVRRVPDHRHKDVAALEPGAVEFSDLPWDEFTAHDDAGDGYTWQNLTYVHVHWEALEVQHIQIIAAALADRLTPAGANKALSALRGVLGWVWRLGWIDAEKLARLTDSKGPMKPVRGRALSPASGRALTEGEIAALIRACEDDPTNAGVRDAAIIAFMVATGARRSSVVKLNMSDYDQASGRFVMREAKGNVTIEDWLTNGAKRAFDDWLAVRGDTPGAVFLPISQKDVIQYHKIDHNGETIHQKDRDGKEISDKDGNPIPVLRRLTGQSIYHILKKRGQAAGIAPFTPHDLRRTVISDLLDRGVDLATIQRKVGHADPATTARYDRRPGQAVKDANDKLHIPYRGNKRQRLPIS